MNKKNSYSYFSDPPAYEQALKVGDKTFAPNYPVYRRATSYSSNNSTN